MPIEDVTLAEKIASRAIPVDLSKLKDCVIVPLIGPEEMFIVTVTLLTVLTVPR